MTIEGVIKSQKTLQEILPEEFYIDLIMERLKQIGCDVMDIVKIGSPDEFPELDVCQSYHTNKDYNYKLITEHTNVVFKGSVFIDEINEVYADEMHINIGYCLTEKEFNEIINKKNGV